MEELVLKKNDIINKMLFITKRVQILEEDDIEKYFDMVEEREILVNEIKTLDIEIKIKIKESSTLITDEQLGNINSINSNIVNNTNEIINSEQILLDQIEEISKNLKKEAKTIAQGKYTKSIYQKEFDLEPSKINKYT